MPKKRVIVRHKFATLLEAATFAASRVVIARNGSLVQPILKVDPKQVDVTEAYFDPPLPEAWLVMEVKDYEQS